MGKKEAQTTVKEKVKKAPRVKAEKPKKERHRMRFAPQPAESRKAFDVVK